MVSNELTIAASIRFALYFEIDFTQTGYANQYVIALRDSNLLNLVQNVTTSIACHLLLNQIHLD